MTPTDSTRSASAQYAQRMNRVMDHIDRHLDQPLEVADLAAVAHFSPFHFHRMFSAWVGEPLGEYVRRRRLEVGALHLAGNARVSVLAVALNVGFGSGEAFARAFKLRFGCSPTVWRRDTPQRWAHELQHARRLWDRKGDQALRKPDQDELGRADEDGGLSNSQESILMQVRQTTLPAVRVAYMRHMGPYGPGIQQFWERKLVPWAQAQGLLPQADCYGIGHDDPHITPAPQCRYDACVAVGEDFVAPSPVGTATLPGGRYAVAAFEGTVEQLHVAWTELLRDWLPASGMQIDARPVMERIPAGTHKDPATGVFACELCIPIRRL